MDTRIANISEANMDEVRKGEEVKERKRSIQILVTFGHDNMYKTSK